MPDSTLELEFQLQRLKTAILGGGDREISIKIRSVALYGTWGDCVSQSFNIIVGVGGDSEFSSTIPNILVIDRYGNFHLTDTDTDTDTDMLIITDADTDTDTQCSSNGVGKGDIFSILDA